MRLCIPHPLSLIPVVILTLSLSGCSLLPHTARLPMLHNPYPQLSKIAIVPFFNQSSEKTVDGRQFALAYFNELQLIPGYEVVPLGVVEGAMREGQIALRGPEDARRLAQILGVDAVVIGAVTDFYPYYPPRCAMRVEWYAATPGFHPIPPGYGLPWGTRAAKQIPPNVIFEAEMALAKEQLKTQTPDPGVTLAQAIPPQVGQPGLRNPATLPGSASLGEPAAAANPAGHEGDVRLAGPAGGAEGGRAVWPDPHGFVPPPPSPVPPSCWPSNAPVMSHTQTYNGHDVAFTDALEDYYLFRDDARFGGWQGYLERSDDFVRFCCYLHIREMLTSRGGAGETRVVWRWPIIR